ncbi:thioesterase II family protein [Aminipila sp.]|uniref:thioesterase II family protein n=1 Tax=Aminipila sp. TaxID=2060095 RepID=UPI00289D4C5D|nr:thioesterase domain-containing protein [Aminipila sp.]
MRKIRLFCLPYAGGNANIYFNWRKSLEKYIELCPLELAGRGRRYEEPFYETLDDAIEDIYNIMKDQIKNIEFAFYGHSMGSIIAYELVLRFQERLGIIPKHVFFSGHRAPNVASKDKKTYFLPDEEFKNEVLKLGGTPKEILENAELVEFFLPLLRADFKIIENYCYQDKKNKLNCDITVLNGKKDDLTLNDIVEWRNHTNGQCKIIMLDGGHFFINDNTENIVNIINNTL